jgi:hypothetical protein
MKYILFALLLVGLWVTEPLWLKSNTSQTPSPVETQITEQERQRAELIASEAARQKELEIKFGPKPYGKYSTGVPASVYQYWDKTLKYPESLEEERCAPIRAGSKGWTTVCRYRAKTSSGSLQLMQDTFTIKDGVAYK